MIMAHKVVITMPSFYSSKNLDEIYAFCKKKNLKCELREE